MNIDRHIHYWAHMLDECFNKEQFLTEGKHWPEDYIKTAYNTIKSSQLGQQLWYTDDFIRQDIQTFVNEFSPLSHKNSNLGFFAAIIRWFIEYSGSSKERYQEFIERKLDNVIAGLLKIRADKEYDARAEEIKKMSFDQFMQLVDEVNAKTSNDADVAVSDAEYEVIPIYSYEELHEKYGGDKTGWNGESEWCHTNGKSTYNSWTEDGTKMFFVIQRKNWQIIEAPEYKPENCYDAYGMSLIAILIDVITNKLLNSTSRWNHIVLPQSGAADKMFKNWQQLNKAVGIDVESICRQKCVDIAKKLKGQSMSINQRVERILMNVDIIDSSTIPSNFVKNVTEINIPNNIMSILPHTFNDFYRKLMNVTIPGSVTNISDYAFAFCFALTNVTMFNGVKTIGRNSFQSCHKLMYVTMPNSIISIGNDAFCECGIENIVIPDGVTNIGNSAFFKCNKLRSIVIPDSVTSIGYSAFYGCNKHMSVQFKNRTLKQIQMMTDYPWEMPSSSTIKCTDGDFKLEVLKS